MKKQLVLSFLMVLLTLALSFCVSATDVYSEADINDAINSAEEGAALVLDVKGDIEVSSKITISKAITVTVNFGGNTISYSSATAPDNGNTVFYVSNSGATLNINGSNELLSAKDYTHYDSRKKADITSTANVITVIFGKINIKNAYLVGGNNAWVIHNPLEEQNDTEILVENSVLRVPQGSSKSAITMRGGNSANWSVVKRALKIENSVVYGGFKGSISSNDKLGAFNFNVTVGSSFTNVRFYDFAIENDCWYDPTQDAIAALLPRSVNDAVLFESCSFLTYGGEISDIKVTTYTGKQNIKLYNCEYSNITGGLYSDKGGQAYIFVVTEAPTCDKDGLAVRYGSGLSTSNVTISANGHKFNQVEISYPYGYASRGVGQKTCVVCEKTEATDDIFDPIFEALGYSVFEHGGSVTLGAMVNRSAYDAYVASSGNTIEYGIIVGNEQMNVTCENGEIFVENGFIVPMTIYKDSIFNIKVINITDSTADKKFAMEFYAYDGEKLEYVENEYDFMSYNDIKESLDRVVIAVKELLETKHKLYYNDDGSFKVMTLSDLHMNVDGNAAAVQSVKDRIKLLVDRENPDLVIFTGDNVISSGSEEKLRRNIDAIVSYIEEKQIPWCHVYGNHDRERSLSNAEQQKIYESYEYCISKAGPEDVTGVGNYVHGIYNKDGSLGAVIYLLDTGTSNGTYTYDYLQPDQIEWYKETSELLQEYNDGKLVYGMMAFHIPLIENRTARDNKDNKELVYEYTGAANEQICSTEYKDDQMFETILERGDIKAIVSGHDHVNDYMYNYLGVKLCSSPNISDLTYKDANVQGSRVFDLNASTITDIETYVSYVIERINPDKYGAYDSNVELETFENDGKAFSTTGYDSGSLSGSATAVTENGKLVITRTTTGNFEVDIVFDSDSFGKLGDNKYLVVWADFTNVEFRKACFGLLSTEGTKPYRTDDYDKNSPFYYLADGSDEWVTMSHGGDGCFGVAQGSNMLGKKGYFALPVEYFRMGSLAMNENTLITGIYLYADIANNSYANVPFYLDNFMLVEDYTQINK